MFRVRSRHYIEKAPCLVGWLCCFSNFRKIPTLRPKHKPICVTKRSRRRVQIGTGPVTSALPTEIHWTVADLGGPSVNRLPYTPRPLLLRCRIQSDTLDDMGNCFNSTGMRSNLLLIPTMCLIQSLDFVVRSRVGLFKLFQGKHIGVAHRLLGEGRTVQRRKTNNRYSHFRNGIRTHISRSSRPVPFR